MVDKRSESGSVNDTITACDPALHYPFWNTGRQDHKVSRDFNLDPLILFYAP